MLKRSFIIALLFVSSSYCFAFAGNFSAQDLITALDNTSFGIPNITSSTATTTAPEFETNSMMFFSLAMMGMIAYRRLRTI